MSVQLVLRYSLGYVVGILTTHIVYMKESGAMILSLDALFSQPRKKAAGKSHRDPSHGDLLFGNQSSVDEHVAMYRIPNQQAGNVCFEVVLQLFCFISYFTDRLVTTS